MWFNPRCFAFFSIFALLLLGSRVQSQSSTLPHYTITDLGTLSGDATSSASQINNYGQVVGLSSGTGFASAPFLWTPSLANGNQGMMIALTEVSGREDAFRPPDINNAGEVVGETTFYGTPGGSIYSVVPFHWIPVTPNKTVGTLFRIPFPAEGIYGINKNGVIVGTNSASLFTPTFYQYLYASTWVSNGLGDHTEQRLANTGNGYYSWAYGINDLSEVVGSAIDAPVYNLSPHHNRPVLWSNGKSTVLTGNGFQLDNAWAIAINNNSKIVGSWNFFTSNYAVTWDKDQSGNYTLSFLSSLSTYQVASGLNTKGEVVGYAEISNSSHGVMWDSNGNIYDLNDLIPEKSGWTLQSASGINDRGQIVGTGTYNGKQRAFLLSRECSPDSPTYTGDIPDSQAPLGTGHDWTFRAEVSQQQGVIIHDVMLRSRYMAEQISLPYLQATIKDSSGRVLFQQKGKLTWNSDADTMRCRLVDLHWGYEQSSDDTIPKLVAAQGVSTFVLEATYVVDRLGPSKSYICVTQRYEFRDSVPGDRGEPTGLNAIARFFPVVKYEFHADAGETLEFNAVQRCHFEDMNQVFNTATFFKDNDFPVPTPSLTAVATPVGGNPLTNEHLYSALANGQGGETDNVHQTFEASTDPPIAFPIPTPGCQECVHIHWKWSYAAAVFGKFLHPLENNSQYNGGAPLIPSGSNQSVDVAVIKYNPAEPEDSDLSKLLKNNEDLVTAFSLLFYYSSTGRQAQDAFFVHGGFFALPADDVSGTIRVTRGVFRYNRLTGRFVQQVTLTNTSTQNIAGPFSLVLDNLSSNAALHNKTDQTTGTIPLRSPYIDVPTGNILGVFYAGISITVTLDFDNPGLTKPITYNTRVLAGGGLR